jgi:hypothetical protein
MKFLAITSLLSTALASVITANFKTFDELVLKSNHVVMVEFFARKGS